MADKDNAEQVKRETEIAKLRKKHQEEQAEIDRERKMQQARIGAAMVVLFN